MAIITFLLSRDDLLRGYSGMGEEGASPPDRSQIISLVAIGDFCFRHSILLQLLFTKFCPSSRIGVNQPESFDIPVFFSPYLCHRSRRLACRQQPATVVSPAGNWTGGRSGLDRAAPIPIRPSYETIPARGPRVEETAAVS